MSRDERLGEVPAEEISQAVSRVVASEDFANSRRLQRFLTYVAEKKIGGRSEELKEYSIALAVFDRPPTFDARTDTIVRVEARRLRQQLAAYYRGAGEHDPVLIEIPKGGYGPVFHFHNGAAQAFVEAAPVAVVPPRDHRMRWAVLGAVMMFAVIGAVLWMTGILPSRAEPDDWRIEAGRLQILSMRHEVLWERRLPRMDQSWETEVIDKVVLADLEGNGHKEVLVSVSADNPRDGGSILCFERDGRLRWEHRLGGEKTFGSRTFENRYRGRLMRLVTVAGNRVILAIANHYIWYPSQVSLIDPRTGKLLDEYWHPGAILHCVIHDIDQDGEPEALLGGINNPGQGLGHASLAVLKLPFSRVPRPAFPTLTGGGEWQYALFPLPDVSRVMGLLPLMARLSVDANHRIFVETPTPENGGIVYYLDSRLRVSEHRFSDNFPHLHERLFRQKLLDHALGGREAESLSRTVLFPAAPDGNDPAIEKLWQ